MPMATAVLAMIGSLSNLQTAHGQTSVPELPTITVISLEYPPFLGSTLDGYGLTFAKLFDYAKAHFKVGIKPDFLPPARAKQQVLGDDWCISTYPAEPDDTGAHFVRLLDETIKIGLYRKRRSGNPTPFVWDTLYDLRGQSIALLRTNSIGVYERALMTAGVDIIYVDSRHQAFQMLLSGRVDYAQSDNFTLAAMPDISEDDVEFSQTYMFEVESGFFYRLSCAEQIFKDGHAPHLATAPNSNDLNQ